MADDPGLEARADSRLREATLSATARLLATEGIKSLTVRRIAQAAGCSTMAVYHYFDGKSGLLEAVYAEGHTRLRAAQQAHHGALDPRAGVRATCLAYRDVALAYPDYFIVMFGKAFGEGGGVGAANAIARENYAGFLDVVRRWGAAVPLTVDPEPAAYSLWAAGHGMVMLELTSHAPQAARAENYVAMIDSLMRGMER